MGSQIWPFIVAGCVVAVGCGGAGNEDLFQQPGTSGKGSTGGSAGSGASSSGGSSASGGSGGSSTGGSSTGGSSTGGSSGSGTGGTGTGGMNTGGSTGGMNTGGSTGGMSTGGSPASGGTGGMSTGGSPASGGTGGEPPGSGGVGVGGGPAGSGGDGGALAGRGGFGGAGGEPNCEALAEQYQKALEAAQICSPEIDRPQCTVQVQSSVPCGCPVWANVDNEEELAALEKLAQQAERCIVICPAVLCVEPGSGICTSSGSGSGHCASGIGTAK